MTHSTPGSSWQEILRWTQMSTPINKGTFSSATRKIPQIASPLVIGALGVGALGAGVLRRGVGVHRVFALSSFPALMRRFVHVSKNSHLQYRLRCPSRSGRVSESRLSWHSISFCRRAGVLALRSCPSCWTWRRRPCGITRSSRPSRFADASSRPSTLPLARTPGVRGLGEHAVTRPGRSRS